MAVYFADDTKELSFGVQASNVFEVAQFSSTLDDVVVRMFTNNGSTTDNMTTGVAIGSSNYDKTATASNNLYLGHISGGSNINPVLLMQDSKIAINTVPSNYSLTVHNGTYTDTLTTQWITATNYDQTFSNISGFTYINNATVAAGQSNILGTVPFTVNFNGNSIQYTYTLNFISNNTLVSTSVSTVSNSNIAYYSSNFTTGTYGMQLGVTTPGSGTGSHYYNSNAGSFTVGAVDTLKSAPSVSLSGTPIYSTDHIAYISGIPYYGSGTTITFPAGSLHFSRMYEAIDPRPLISTAMTLCNIISSAPQPQTTTSNYNYSSIYTNVTTHSSTNDVDVSLILGGTGNGLLSIYDTVFSTFSHTTSQLSVTPYFYLGTPPNETALPTSSFTGMPISMITRMSVQNDPSNLASFPLSSLIPYTSLGAYDVLYNPNTGLYVCNALNFTYTDYVPNISLPLSSRAYFAIRLTPTIPLTSFVLTMNNSLNNGALFPVYVAWAGVNGGAWYDASMLYNAASSPGCAAAIPTYSPGSPYRYPIRLPQNQSLSTAANVFILIKMDTSSQSTCISQAGISVSYS